jgi:homoserine O-acetyltransferase
MDSFEFEYGRVLENVEVSYSTYGTPKYDDEGYITNAVLFFATFKGAYSFLSEAHQYILNNSGFIGDEFYFIVINSLGSPESCSPSTTKLKFNFPNYTYFDLVNFQRQFLAEKFKIKKILGLIGEGYGAFQALTWACEYPDDMEFLFAVNVAAKVAGYKYIIAKSIDSIIESIDDFYSEEYSVSKTRSLVAINTLIFAHSSAQYTFHNLNNDEIDVILEDFIDEGLFLDIYDIKFHNDALLQFDIEDRLSNIKAKTLIASTNSSHYFDFKTDMLPLKDMIKDSIVIQQENSKKEYYFSDDDYEPIGKQVISFLEQFKK